MAVLPFSRIARSKLDELLRIQTCRKLCRLVLGFFMVIVKVFRFFSGKVVQDPRDVLRQALQLIVQHPALFCIQCKLIRHFLRRADMLRHGKDLLFRKLQGCPDRAAFQGTADEDPVEPLFQHPCCPAFIIGRQILSREAQVKRLACPRHKFFRLGEGTEPSALLVKPSLRKRDVDLDDFFPRIDIPAVRHRDRNMNPPVPVHSRTACLDAELRVGETIAEAVSHRNAEGIKAAVSHIDPFLISLLLYIAIVMRKCLRIRIIFIAKRPGIRQLSARNGHAADDIRHRMSAFLPRLSHKEQPSDLRKFIRKRQICHPAGVDDHQHILIHAAQIREHPVLFAAQIVISPGCMPVRAFARCAAEHIDRQIRLRAIHLRPCRN